MALTIHDFAGYGDRPVEKESPGFSAIADALDAIQLRRYRQQQLAQEKERNDALAAHYQQLEANDRNTLAFNAAKFARERFDALRKERREVLKDTIPMLGGQSPNVSGAQINLAGVGLGLEQVKPEFTEQEPAAFTEQAPVMPGPRVSEPDLENPYEAGPSAPPPQATPDTENPYTAGGPSEEFLAAQNAFLARQKAAQDERTGFENRKKLFNATSGVPHFRIGGEGMEDMTLVGGQLMRESDAAAKAFKDFMIQSGRINAKDFSDRALDETVSAIAGGDQEARKDPFKAFANRQQYLQTEDRLNRQGGQKIYMMGAGKEGQNLSRFESSYNLWEKQKKIPDLVEKHIQFKQLQDNMEAAKRKGDTVAIRAAKFNIAKYLNGVGVLTNQDYERSTSGIAGIWASLMSKTEEAIRGGISKEEEAALDKFINGASSSIRKYGIAAVKNFDIAYGPKSFYVRNSPDEVGYKRSSLMDTFGLTDDDVRSAPSGKTGGTQGGTAAGPANSAKEALKAKARKAGRGATP